MMDRLFVMRGRHRSTDDLRRIYEKYRDSLLILAIALSHDVSVAEDAVHDVFVAFAEHFADFKLTGSLKGYLATCVANRVRDLMRKREVVPVVVGIGPAAGQRQGKVMRRPPYCQ